MKLKGGRNNEKSEGGMYGDTIIKSKRGTRNMDSPTKHGSGKSANRELHYCTVTIVSAKRRKVSDFVGTQD